MSKPESITLRVEWLGANHANKSGKSDKFYEITITPETEQQWGDGWWWRVVARYGKFGTKGQTKDYGIHHSQNTARYVARRILDKKLAKGYTEPVDALTRLARVMEDD
jgi:predicted DNA-binding WGR domain protein